MSEPASLPVAPPDEPDEFRHVPDMPGYCASRSGRVFSSVRWGQWRELRPQRRSSNYYVFVMHGGRDHWRKVAEMVAETFVGPKPDGHCVLFVDRCRWNTAAKNLRWATHAEAATYYTPVGERSSRAKLTGAQVVGLRKRVHQADMDGADVDWAAESERLECSIENLKAVASCKTWKHVDAGVPAWVPGRRRAPRNSKLAVEDVRAIKRRLKNGESPLSISRTYEKVSVRAIQAIETGQNWSHVTL